MSIRFFIAIFLLPVALSAIDFSDKFIVRGKDGVEIPATGHTPNLTDGTILNGGEPVIYGARQNFEIEILSQSQVSFPIYGVGQSGQLEYWRFRKPSIATRSDQRINPGPEMRFLATYPRDNDFFATVNIMTLKTGDSGTINTGFTAPRGLRISFDVWFFPSKAGEQTATVEIILLDSNVLPTHAIGAEHEARVFRFQVEATGVAPGTGLALSPGSDSHLSEVPSIAGQSRSLLNITAQYSGPGTVAEYVYRVVSAKHPARAGWSRALAVGNDLDVTVLVDRSTPLSIQAIALDAAGEVLAYDLATGVMVGPDLEAPGRPLERDSQGLPALQREAMGESIQDQPRMIIVSQNPPVVALEWRRNTTRPDIVYEIQRSRNGTRWITLQGLSSTVHDTDGDFEVMRTPIPPEHANSWFRVLITDSNE